MKYTLNETSFQPSLSANIQIYQIFGKKGNPSPIFFARQRARAEKPRESLIRSRPRYAALERREKEGGGSLPLPRMNTRFRTLPRYTNFFFFFSSSLWATWWSCVQPLEEFTAVGESLVLRFSFQRWSWKYHAEGTNKLVKSRCVVIFPTLLMLFLVLWIRLNCDLFLFILLWIKKLMKK